jgi:cytochrome P450
MTTDVTPDRTPERFPFPEEPLGAVPRGYIVRQDDDPLGLVTLPSGDVVRLATRFDDVVAVLTGPGFSRDLTRPGCPRLQKGADIADQQDTLINMDAPRHTKLRRILAGPFAARRVQKWRPRIRQIALELTEAMRANGSQADLVTAFAEHLPIRVIAEMLGVAGDDLDRFRHWSTVSMTIGAESEGERAVARRDFFAYMHDLIAKHRMVPGTDLLDAMIQATDEGDRLTEDELVHAVRSMLLAGYETTMTTISRGAFTLLRHPRQYKDLVADPGLIPAAVDEILRHDFPADVGFLRVATTDVELPSGMVRRGEGVMPLISAAHRDSGRFTDPEAFDIRRAAGNHIAFGQGPHYCLGAALAKIQLLEAFDVLTNEFPDLTLAVEPAEVAWNPSGMTHSIKRLPVRWSSGGTVR